MRTHPIDLLPFMLSKRRATIEGIIYIYLIEATLCPIDFP